jgi:hypothetical protein
MNKKSEFEGFGCLVVIGVIGVILYAVFEELDSNAWVPHREDSIITAQANWFVGESKECMSYPVLLQKGNAISLISCDGGPEHSVKVTFYGRVKQPEYRWINWRCTRNEDSFTCKQTGNSPAIKRSTDQGTGKPIVSYDDGKTWQWADQN